MLNKGVKTCPGDQLTNSPRMRLWNCWCNCVWLVPTEFSWLLDGLNMLDCPSGEELRCHSFWVKWKWNAAVEVPKYVCAGSSVWVRGELEGHQLRGQLTADLFNQSRATQQVTTEIKKSLEKKDFFFFLSLPLSSPLLPTNCRSLERST